MKVLIAGGGNMGYSFAESFLDAHVLRPNDLTILEAQPERAAWLRSHQRVQVAEVPHDALAQVDLLVLAVKPQDAAVLYAQLADYVQPHQLVLSIMAGVTIGSIQAALPTRKVVRSMPNLPSQVGMGMTAFTAAPEVTRQELIQVQNLLSTTGRAIYLEQETLIDAATAVSGSGPAYVYYFMNAMIEAAMQMGFSEAEAELLVWQTFTGAMHLHNKNNLSCKEWISRVASKGGTTEAAIRVFDAGAMHQLIQQGVYAAFQRAQELGQ